MIKCKCGIDSCKANIRVQTDGIYFQTNKGEEGQIVYDANNLLEFIRELQKVYIQLLNYLLEE